MGDNLKSKLKTDHNCNSRIFKFSYLNIISLNLSMKLNVILTGATGMVGEGVLLECLHDDQVEKVLIINRRPSGIQHPKLKEIIHADFFNFIPIKHELVGYNTCFFCLGVSSIGMKEPQY
jgi:hypothetical protein